MVPAPAPPWKNTNRLLDQFGEAPPASISVEVGSSSPNPTRFTSALTFALHGSGDLRLFIGIHPPPR